MKKIGFIDYYLDQYHAENYPVWIKEISGGEMEVAYAWAMIDSPTGKSNAKFCEEMNITFLDTIEAVIEKSDYLIVMAPDNSETHEALSRLALLSGKPTYVDKAFAPDRAAALRMIETAKKGNTPFFSSSALRFSNEYINLEKAGIESINSRGPGMFETYAIHQIEPIVSLMGPDIDRIMFIGSENTPAFVFKYEDDRYATIAQLGWEADFSLAINYEGDKALVLQGASDFYRQFIFELVKFFKSEIPPVTPEEILSVISVIEFGKEAIKTPETWIKMPK